MADVIDSVPAASASEEFAGDAESQGLLAGLVSEILGSYINITLVVVIGYLLYKIVRGRSDDSAGRSAPVEPELPKLRRDFTIQELKQYDGNQTDGRVLMAVNGTVYDVTKGKRFYGPGGPYAAFAGRDASRGLATFQVTANDEDKYDDLSDLNTMEMDSVKEWEMQFKEKYTLVGKLLRPGEEPSSYSDEEDESAPTAAAPDASPITNLGATATDATSADKPKAE